jgi:glucose/mannose-6-phosphate isomerase
MLAAVGGLSEDCRHGYGVGRATEGLPSAEGVTAIAVCGMGGSAVAGDVFRALYVERLGLPIQVVRSPSLPEFCGPRTLVVASSYSGNTAETLTCFEEAVRRGCRVVAVTSGGCLGDRAAELGLARVVIPTGYQPRAALGWLALGTLGAIEAMGLVPPLAADVDDAATELASLVTSLAPEVPTAENPAKRIAVAATSRTPVVWGAEGYAAVAAMRWKTQFNENAKVPAFHSSMSELDHNEIVGWSAGEGERYLLIALRAEGEHPEIGPRFPLSEDIARRAGARVEEVWARGRSALARLLTLITVGDFASVYLALARGVDPTPVEVVERLKRSLAGA